VRPLDHLKAGLSAETDFVATREMTIGHFVAGMPPVYATPVMVLHMEMAAGSAIASAMPDGFVSVGMAIGVPCSHCHRPQGPCDRTSDGHG
jgi:fluoroacetyl-CoA thioesterase